MKTVEEKVNELYGKISIEFRTAFVSAMLFGLIAHVYMFTNKLPNFDDLVGLDGFGVTFKNGRWFLWVLGAIAYHLDWVFSLPWINGLTTLITIAVSAGIITHLLGCRSRISNIFIGAILVVFPSWTATFFYMFTAPYYGFAVLLATISVYLTVKTRFGFVGGIILLACSMGIYQSYLPFTATLYVVLLIVMLFEDKYTYLDILKSSFYYLFNLIGGIVVYFICMKLSLAITGQELNDYKGLSNMGQFDFSRIGEIAQTVWENFFCIFMNNNMEISYNLVTKIMYFVLICGSIFLIGNLMIKQIRQKDYLKAIETVVLSVAYVVAINAIYIMCSDGIYSLMYYSYSFMIIFPFVLLDRTFRFNKTNFKIIFEYVILSITAFGIFSYCHFANGQYLSMDLSFEQAVSYYNTMITAIKSADGYRDTMKVAFKGETITDETLYRNDVMNTFSMSGRDDALADAYSRIYLLKYYCGFDAEFITVEEMPSAAQEEIANMPLYPDDGSVKVIDNVVVVKIS